MKSLRTIVVASALLLVRCDCASNGLKAADLKIEVEPTAIDFGTQYVGSTSYRQLQVKVSGRGAVDLTAASFSQDTSVLSINFHAGSVQAQKLALFTVTYQPLEPGDDSNTLVLTTTLPGSQRFEIPIHALSLVDCVDNDGDGAGEGAQCPLGWDCDDTNPNVHPGATEICGNGLDDDCDPSTTDICPCTIDRDQDGYVDGADCPNPDCNDRNPAIHPGAEEICGNGIDDDCNPATSDICPCTTDADGDGYPEGAECPNADCDDTNPNVHPGATEICGNGIDDDCNPATSDVCPCVDHDGDGYGMNCALGPDCDDERASVNPGMTEICGNGLDDDCNPLTPDNCVVNVCPNGCGVGCADGQREAFIDQVRYPAIAGCAGGWYLPGIWREDPPSCGRHAGDDSSNPWGSGCNASDLCAEGWHVCRTAQEVATRSVDGCDGANGVSGLFFATRQSGNGCQQCSVSSNPSDICGGDTCRTSCYSSSSQTNDVFGCGTTGGAPASSCAPLNRFSNNNCSSLSTPWSCSGSVQEALTVTKPGPGGGGVLCCAD